MRRCVLATLLALCAAAGTGTTAFAAPLNATTYDCSVPCDPCLGANIAVDIVFIVDGSGSMQNAIDGVRRGLRSFAAEVDARDLSPRYFVVMTGYVCNQEQSDTYFGPELLLNGTSSGDELIATMNGIRAGNSSSGLHTWHGGQVCVSVYVCVR